MPTNKELEQMLAGAVERTSGVEGVVSELRDTVAQLDAGMSGLDAKLDHVLNALSGMSAKDRGTGTRHEFDARSEVDPADGRAAEFRESRIDVDEPELVMPGVADVESPAFKAKMETLAFLRQPVTVHIHETSEAFADQAFEVSVNGRGMVFQRGREYTVPRYIVEGLARAKPASYKNEQYRAADGSDAVRYPVRRGVRYPFSVVSDPAGSRGEAWLKIILAQP